MSAYVAGRMNYKPGSRTQVSLVFFLMALACLFVADLRIYPSDPWLEFSRFFSAILRPEVGDLTVLVQLITNTLTFALIGVALSSVFGFFLALYFQNHLIRIGCASVRAVHELFWALVLMQIFGLTVLTGILAIAIPYSGIFAKVYAEILEEANTLRRDMLHKKADRLSVFLFSKVPDVWGHIKSYTLYRLECGLRSSAILGFIGLPTLGYSLESAFSQGHYSEVWFLLIIFYLIISSIGLWMRKSLLPVYLIASLILLPKIESISLNNVIRFFTQDIIPYPLRVAENIGIGTIGELGNWFWAILTTQALPGIWNTLVLTQIALVTTALLALVFFPLVSSQFLDRYSRTLGHILLVVLRSTPEYILAYILLQLWGPSMLPAVIAISLHNGAIIGHLIGRQSGMIPLRIDSTSKRINRYSFEVVPRVYGQFLAFLFYRWEIIFRETAILGILGIYTLGFYIDSAIQDLRMDRAILLIIITAMINIIIDTISQRIRRKLRLNSTATL